MYFIFSEGNTYFSIFSKNSSINDKVSMVDKLSKSRLEALRWLDKYLRPVGDKRRLRVPLGCNEGDRTFCDAIMVGPYCKRSTSSPVTEE